MTPLFIWCHFHGVTFHNYGVIRCHHFSYGVIWCQSVPAWRALSDPSESTNNETCKIINWIRSDIPVYHTRAMRRQFVHRYSLLTSLSPAILTETRLSAFDQRGFCHSDKGISRSPDTSSVGLGLPRSRLGVRPDNPERGTVDEVRQLLEGSRSIIHQQASLSCR